MPSPHAVAINASPMPPVTAPTANSALPSDVNVLMMPVTVPSSPSNGDSVTSVSITGRNRPARRNTAPAAACIATCNEVSWWLNPSSTICTTGTDARGAT